MTDEDHLDLRAIAPVNDPAWPHVDLLLSAIVEAVEHGARAGAGGGRGPSMDLTITTIGGTLSGTLISRSAWVEDVTTGVARSSQQFSDDFAALAERFEPSAEDDVMFFHLTDAWPLTGNALGDNGMKMRVRLLDVTAWSLAKLRS